MAEIFEAAMILCFGISWPASLVKSIRVRTAKGKSIIFLLFVWCGYIAGILGKLLTHNITYVLFFYVLNFTMISADLIVYFRNRRLDRQRARECEI
jgi:tellurite resistance protein TehA-like permease